MYAVITVEGRLAYLGECRDKALEVFNTKEGIGLHLVDSPEELNALLDEIDDADDVVEGTSEDFKTLVGKLDELGLNKDLVAKIADNSNYLMGEAKSLGIKGMKAVGEGFVALGDLLRKATEIKEECFDEKPCCGHQEHKSCCAHDHENN